MAKRKAPETAAEPTQTPSKRPRRNPQDDIPHANGTQAEAHSMEEPLVNGTPTENRGSSRPKRKSTTTTTLFEVEETDQDEPVPKSNGRTLFSTPRKKRTLTETPSKSKRADRSAKRKSAQILAEANDEDDWDGEHALARAILDEEEEEEERAEDDALTKQPGDETVDPNVATPVKTPGKRGRPKGAKNKRSPTPEGDIPPEERYFYQNRAGPPQISSNKFNSVKLLNLEEYQSQMQTYKDHHDPDKAHLMKLHARSFPQWRFELSQGFGLCLYGYGSKRKLVNNFAEWLHKNSKIPPRIVIVNGYTAKLNVRGIVNAVASALVGEEERLRLVGQPHELVDGLFEYLANHPPRSQLIVMVNSIDASPIRRASAQSVLARLADHPLIHFVATADTPTFPSLWNSSLLNQFKFVFHDSTTFAPYPAEIQVVDEVHDLLGRKKLRVGGKEGIGFVLKSLPENARNLYRVLLSEILTILGDRQPNGDRQKTSREPADEVGIEYRTLYQKASEEFICSSSMNFQFLLKEFHDHQMITSKRDSSGTEMLGVPLIKDEMEAVLEDLVL
ncbi:hypothetical protein B0A52_03435 [Exophiala mesophila]|uniref:Origin recognition complex subunit 2 n=1 Tax=Exophiala mesophila TaxID=212818 RepID=A0A438N5S3_EXOME|nr:hypothetical protein B0A52_03435 [Exophiala mesophila]